MKSKQAGGKWFSVETGRRDGTISSATEASNSLPGPSIPDSDAVSLFASKGLNATDFVLLLGNQSCFISFINSS